MKAYFFILFTVWLLVFPACRNTGGALPPPQTDYKQKMRDFVTEISRYAKTSNPDFLIIPQNGIELVTLSGKENGTPAIDYLNAIDGNGQEDLFYGYYNDNQATPAEVTETLKKFLDISKKAGNTILVTDYCSDREKINDAYAKDNVLGYAGFVADHRELDNIPSFPSQPYHENTTDIGQLSQVKNFLYLINPQNFDTKAGFIRKIKATGYDLIVMDLFFNNGEPFSSDEIHQLKKKPGGGRRLVVCYLSIGEAETYRYYWKPEWKKNPPRWLDKPNPDWPGNYKVKYWDPRWQAIFFGNDSAYLHKIMAAGFDGAYLDIIDAFEYFENR